MYPPKQVKLVEVFLVPSTIACVSANIVFIYEFPFLSIWLMG